MRIELAPQGPRLASWTWVWLAVGLLAGPGYSFAQDSKSGDPAKAATKPDDTKKDAGKGMVDTKARRKVDPPEIYDDRNAKAALEIVRELYPNTRMTPADEANFTQMAQGALGVDPAAIANYVRYQVSELTRKSNIQALGNMAALPQQAQRIGDATEKLVKPFLIAPTSALEGFRRAYVGELVKVAPDVLRNHLYARNALLIVLKESGDSNAFPVYANVLRDKSQVLAAKISAAEGIAKAASAGRPPIGAQQAGAAAEALGQFLSDEPNAFWWAQWNALHALGALRQASSRPAQGKPELAEIALKFLADPKARLDVRAYAAWALGMMQVPSQVKNYNYPLVAHQISQLAVELGTRVSQTRREELAKAQHATKLLLLLVEALGGDPQVRNSGIANVDSNAIAPYLEKVRAVAIAAVDYDRSVSAMQAGRKKKLDAAIDDLKTAVDGKAPKDKALVPGGEPLVVADGAAAAPAK